MSPVRTDTTRERIVAAAAGCFARYGVPKTTVEHIAAAAGLSRATVYRAFTGGRDELIMSVVLRDLTSFLDVLKERLAAEQTAAAAIVEGVLDAVAWIRAAPQIAPFLAPEGAGPAQAAVAGSAARVLELCSAYVRPYFDLAQRNGQLRPDIDVDGTMEFLFRMITSLALLPRDRDAEADRAFLRTYVVPVLVGR